MAKGSNDARYGLVDALVSLSSCPRPEVRVLKDDAGHTYLIPVGKEAAWEAWCKALEEYVPYSGEGFLKYQLNGPVSDCIFELVGIRGQG